MKKLLLLFLLIPNFVMAEIYNCQYKWDDKKFKLDFERKEVNLDGKTYTFFLYKQKNDLKLESSDTLEEILHEDDKYLILGTPGLNDFKLFRTIWIDKKNNKFRLVSIKEPLDSFNENNTSEAKPLGIYGVVDGICK